MKKLYTLQAFLLMSSLAYSQNVGIGNSNPQDKLHVSGYLRSDNLQSVADTLVLLASPEGRIISLNAGTSGQVLTSQGTGLAPKWQTPAAGGTPSVTGKMHTKFLGGLVSATVDNSTAPTVTLLSHTFTPINDTVILNFNATGWVTASTMATSPGHPFLFRMEVNGTSIKQISAAPHRNTSSLADRGRLTVSFSYPVQVNPGVPNTVVIRILTLFTAAGSITMTFDPTTLSNSGNLVIHDFPTN